MSSSHEISVSSSEIADGIMLQPDGDIDLSGAPSFRKHISDAQRTRPKRLVIDLCSVPYMDSSGVATLVEAMQIARRESTRLVLCGLQERVRSIFEIARLDMVFVIADDQQAALSA